MVNGDEAKGMLGKEYTIIMNYPDEVQERIDYLNKYSHNDDLKEFDIFHMYPGRMAYSEGYSDSRFFSLVGYNTKLMQRRNLGTHDSIVFADDAQVDITRIFVDGSTFIRMREVCVGMDFQAYNVLSKTEYENLFG